jgi:hypothetical protein
MGSQHTNPNDQMVDVVMPDGRRVQMTVAEYHRLQELDRRDPWVKLSDGRIMRQSQFQALQAQQIATYQAQMTTFISQLHDLSGQMSGIGGDVYSLLSQLRADMTAIEQWFGSDDNASKVRGYWQQGWDALQKAIDASGQRLNVVADGLEKTADQILDAENQSLKGFNVTVVDPRRPPGHRPMPDF